MIVTRCGGGRQTPLDGGAKISYTDCHNFDFN